MIVKVVGFAEGNIVAATKKWGRECEMTQALKIPKRKGKISLVCFEAEKPVFQNH